MKANEFEFKTLAAPSGWKPPTRIRREKFDYLAMLKSSAHQLHVSEQKRRAVLYAVNENPLYHFLLLESISSLRTHNLRISIYVVVNGRVSETLRKAKARLSFEIIPRPYLSPPFDLMLKWLALSALPKIENLLVLDADTYFYGDVGKFFKKYNRSDFAARRELGTESKGRPHSSQLRESDYRKVLNRFGSKVSTPVFNTGAMLFSRHSHQMVSKQLEIVFKAQAFFVRYPDRYPSPNPHLVEEICASLLLGTLPLKLGQLSPKDAPIYNDDKGKSKDFAGSILVHMGTHYCREFYQKIGSPEKSVKLRKLMFMGRPR